MFFYFLVISMVSIIANKTQISQRGLQHLCPYKIPFVL